MHVVRVYAVLHKWPLLTLYSYVGCVVFDVSFVTAAKYVLGVAIAHWLMASLVKWSIFLIIGKRWTYQIFLADLQRESLPRPDEHGYELAEHYLDEVVAQSENTSKVAMAAAWRGIVDFLRGTGQIQLLFQFNIAMKSALKQYRRLARSDDA